MPLGLGILRHILAVAQASPVRPIILIGPPRCASKLNKTNRIDMLINNLNAPGAHH